MAPHCLSMKQGVRFSSAERPHPMSLRSFTRRLWGFTSLTINFAIHLKSPGAWRKPGLNGVGLLRKKTAPCTRVMRNSLRASPTPHSVRGASNDASTVGTANSRRTANTVANMPSPLPHATTPKKTTTTRLPSAAHELSHDTQILPERDMRDLCTSNWLCNH